MEVAARGRSRQPRSVRSPTTTSSSERGWRDHPRSCSCEATSGSSGGPASGRSWSRPARQSRP